MISRCSNTLLAVGLCLLGFGALGASCGGAEARRVPDVLDLYPHASSGTDKGEQGLIKLMAETKTHRLVFVGAHETLGFERLDLPASLRFEAELSMLGMPKRSNHPLVLELTTVDEDGTESSTRAPVRTELEKGQHWIPLRVELTAAAPVRELRVQFHREDLGRGSTGRFVLLRPKLHFESELPPEPERDPRQIVLITTDTLRADALGCYGNQEVKTPHMDALAEEGTLFEQAFATTNVTNPSHTSMFTSLYLKDHGVIDNFTKLAPEVPTLLEPLRAAGFRSAAFVSSFNFQPEKSDFDKRFDDFFPCTTYFERRAEDVNLDAFPWLVDHAGDDFFVWLHYFDVHMPYVPPYPYDQLYREGGDEEIELPIDYKGNLNWFSGTRRAGHYRSMYRGEVTYLDDQLGQLFDQMKATGIYERATIVLVSDHGESLGENGVYCDHASLHDEVTQVPLLFKLPAAMNAPGSRRVDALVSTVDLYPTLFELYDLPVPGFVRGASLVPWIRGEAGPARDAAYSTFARGIQESLRTEDSRFLLGIESEALFPHFSVEAGKQELWRRGEAGHMGKWSDVSALELEQRERFASQLGVFLEDKLDYKSIAIDEEYFDEMSNLGYVQGSKDEADGEEAEDVGDVEDDE